MPADGRPLLNVYLEKKNQDNRSSITPVGSASQEERFSPHPPQHSWITYFGNEALKFYWRLSLSKIVCIALSVVGPFILNTINHSSSSGVIRSAFKYAVIQLLLKKPGLDHKTLANFC